MDTFNVPSLLAESSSSSNSNNNNNNIYQHHNQNHLQLQQQQQSHLPHHHHNNNHQQQQHHHQHPLQPQLLSQHQHQQQQQQPQPQLSHHQHHHHHQKDQMLAAGSTPMLPFMSFTTTTKETPTDPPSGSIVGGTGDFGGDCIAPTTLQSIDASQLDGGISLGGLCERIFASPNPHSNNNSNLTLIDASDATKATIDGGTTTITTTTTTNNNNDNSHTRGDGPVVLESVQISVPSFANLLFPTATTTTQTTTLNRSINQSIAADTSEYHQLKTLEEGGGSGGSGGATTTAVSTSSFLSSTAAQMLDFEVPTTPTITNNNNSSNNNNATTTKAESVSVITVHSNNNNNNARNLGDNQISTTTTTIATTTTTANQQQRRSLHSIEELAASSCVPNKSTNNNRNSNHNNTSATKQQKHNNNNNNNNNINIERSQQSESNVSSDDESMSEDEFGLEIDDHVGYQDTTSSHSQQSGGGGGGGGGSSANGSGASGALLNGGSTGGNSGYMLLPPATSSSGHLSGGGGGNGNGNGNGGNPGNIGGGGNNTHGGTSATSGVSGEAIDFKHLFEELCPVCGDKVSGYHYGLLTCESCKGFFKRTVQNKKVYTCVAERSCHIDKTQRKRCPFCRFQKCLEVGMKLEAVRADRMRGGRNKFGPMYKRDRARKLQVMRQRQLALQALRSSMGSDIKPTPLSPGYQQAYPNMNIKQEIQIPQVSSLTQSPDSSPSPIAIALGQVNAGTSGGGGGGVIATPMNGGGSGLGGSGGNTLGNSGNNSSSSSSSSAGSGGGGGGGNNAGGGNNNNNSIDGLQRNGSGGGGNGGGGNGGGSGCHDASTGSLQNTAESKLCFDSGTHPSSTADSLIEPLRVSPMIREFVQSIDDREWQTQLFALLQKQTYNQVEVDLFELMCKVLDQNLFSQVDWARNTVFFKDLKVDDQMKLLQHSWSDMLVLDHLHHRIHNGLPDETQLNNGQVFNLMSLGLLGVPQLGDYFNELQNKLQDLKFDMGDYVCMKFLILLNPDVRGIINKKTVLEGHENVQAALLDYTLTCYPSVNDKFRRLLNILPEIHAMASRGEEHLYSKHCAGSAPTQTLLMEMLHAKRKV